MDEVYSPTFTPKCRQHIVFQKRYVRCVIEVFLLNLKDASRRLWCHSAKYFLRITLTQKRYFRLIAYRRPCLVERWVLTEGRFVFVDNNAIFFFGLFFKLGNVYRIHRFFVFSSARTKLTVGRCTEKPIRRSSFRTCPW